MSEKRKENTFFFKEWAHSANSCWGVAATAVAAAVAAAMATDIGYTTELGQCDE